MFKQLFDAGMAGWIQERTRFRSLLSRPQEVRLWLPTPFRNEGEKGWGTESQRMGPGR
jgi:hypothetical protein